MRKVSKNHFVYVFSEKNTNEITIPNNRRGLFAQKTKEKNLRFLLSENSNDN